MAFPEYESFDALGLAELVQRGEVSAAELVEAAIERIEARDGRVNAVVVKLYERARARAAGDIDHGPFRGVPFIVKDLEQAMAGVPTNNGSRFWQGYVPEEDGELYRRWRGSGIVTVAKSNTPELGLVPVTEPELFGPTNNPWDPSGQRTAGGSSGGSAAAVAAGMVPMASGGDGGGSIRIPASCCGLFGLKPTRMRTPPGPVGERWGGFAIEHVISRSVRDSAAMLDATHGGELGAPYQVLPPGRPFLDEVGAEVGTLRVGFHDEPVFPAEVHADCKAAVEDAASLCEQLGHRVERVSPRHDQKTLALAFLTCVAGHTAAGLAEAERVRGRRAKAGDWETNTKLVELLGRALSAGDFVAAEKTLQDETRRLAHALADYDVILTPTLGQPPIAHGAMKAVGVERKLQELVARANLPAATNLPGMLERAVERVYNFIPFTPLANFTGQPSMSVPLYWNGAGLPVGSMFTARFGDEAVLFRLAAQLEQARPWAERRPPL
ncbi:MAG: amidase [Myxococcales bacterium]|nr:amidase [Myxococcales bacterium]